MVVVDVEEVVVVVRVEVVPDVLVAELTGAAVAVLLSTVLVTSFPSLLTD